MALVLADRVREQSNTSGTGTITLSGAVTGYQTFSSAIGNGNTCYYTIANPGTTEWEVGIGTVGSGTLARTTIISSSNADAAVDFTAGTKDVFVTYPAEKSVYASNAPGTSGYILASGGAGVAPTWVAPSTIVSGAGGSNTQVQYNSSGALAGSSNMTFDGTTLTVNGLSTTGTVTVGDASGDALTINSSAVSIPNGLNFDSNTFVIDATNNYVGVGTSSPTAPLTVKTNSSAQGFSILGRTSDNYAIQRFISADGLTNYATMYSAGGNNLITETGGTERMRIDSSGNVGIGTSSPSSLRATIEANGGQLRIRNTTTRYRSDYSVGSNGTTSFNSYDDSGATYKPMDWTANNHTWYAGSGGTTRSLDIDSSGNLGIGAAPSAWGSSYRVLDVTTVGVFGGSTSAILSGNLYNNGTNWIRKNAQAGGLFYLGTDSSFTFYQTGSSTAGSTASLTQAMTLDASGNLLVGTTTALQKLTVSGSVGSTSYFIPYSGSTVLGYFGSDSSISGGSGSNIGLRAESAMLFATGGSTERMRLDTSGNLGLGVTPSAWANNFRAIQIGNSDPGFLAGRVDGPPWVSLGVNAYNDGSVFRYVNSDYASMYTQYNGHYWYNATSGTAGNTITFTQAMTLDATSSLAVGRTSAIGQGLTVSGSGASIYLEDTNGTTQTWRLLAKTGTTNQFRIYDQTAGADRLVIDSSGNLGLGVTPSSVLSGYKFIQIGSTGVNYFGGASSTGFNYNGYYNAGWKYNATGTATLFDTDGSQFRWNQAASGTAGNAITFTQAMTLDASGNLLVGTTSPSYSSSGRGLIEVNGSSTALVALKRADSESAYLYASSSEFRLNEVEASPMTFYTSNTERMRIDSSGNLLVGTTSVQQSSQLTVAGYIATNGITSHAGTGGAYGTNRFNFQWTGSAALWVDTTNIGNIQVSSDYRIKRNIQTQTAPALERVMALRPVTYQMADYGTLFKASDEIKEGFIAHEVQAVIPSGADGEKDAENQIQSLRVDAILAVAVKAIQELKAEVDSLKAQLNK